MNVVTDAAMMVLPGYDMNFPQLVGVLVFVLAILCGILLGDALLRRY